MNSINKDSVFTEEFIEKIIQSYGDSISTVKMPDMFYMPEYDYLILGGYIWRARWVWIKNKVWGLFK